jgi:Dyp-type peroxidase family
MGAVNGLELEEIQGLVVRGYGNLPVACYLLLTVEDGAEARKWLAELVPEVTTAAARPARHALNVALTHAGLAALGLDEESLGTFPGEFREGMATARRARVLGDEAESAPERWEWGGPGTPPVHLILLVHALDDAAIEELVAPLEAGFAMRGVRRVGPRLDSTLLRDPRSGCTKEHFGFCDGIAQPFIQGLEKPGTAGDRPENTVGAGEFLLGYPNEYSLFTETPTVPAARDPRSLLPQPPQGGAAGARDLGRNGTYLVFRQLQQHVQSFWRFLDERTRRPDGAPDPDARIALAAKMVGRWPDGTPLMSDLPAGTSEATRDNSFDYHAADPRGLRCPLGSHIRRANPRDSLGPEPGSEKSIAVNKRHRLLRRGRPYGPPVHPSLDPRNYLGDDDGVERGIYFICIGANLTRQFEFVQQTWVNNPKFAGLYADPDPLVGAAPEGGGTFTEQRAPVRRRVTGIPRFITTRGGAYAFLPSLTALRYLSTLAAPAVVQATPASLG